MFHLPLLMFFLEADEEEEDVGDWTTVEDIILTTALFKTLLKLFFT